MQIYNPNINDVHYKESKQAGIWLSFTCQKLLMGISPKFLPINIHAIWYLLEL